VKDLYNDVGYALTNYHLRIFKEMIKSLEDAAKKKFESSEAGKKKGFTFKSKFQFKSIQSRPQEVEKEFDLSEKIIVQDESSGIAETKNIQNAKIIIDNEGIKNQYRLAELTNCEVEIKIPLKTLYLHGIKNCRIKCGLIDGAVFGDKIEDSQIDVVAHQIRIHKSKATRFNIFVSSSMIIEDCNAITSSEIKLADLDPQIAERFRESKFASMQNNWHSVKDFNWIKDLPSPNITYVE